MQVQKCVLLSIKLYTVLRRDLVLMAAPCKPTSLGYIGTALLCFPASLLLSLDFTYIIRFRPLCNEHNLRFSRSIYFLSLP